MGYALPTNTDYVSSDYWDHRNRQPPSSEPGTDYASAYGSPLYAVGDGSIVDLKHSNSNATGRYVTIDLDDGRRTRSLHLSEIWVSVGQRVGRGQQIGLTGASAYGSDWGVGAHVHQTLWAGWYYEFCASCTINFEDYVGDAPVAGNQRQVGTVIANARVEPNTNTPPVEASSLSPGTVGTFDGWIRGEAVEGNDVWFRGLFSGYWFWSGGFTDTGTHDLADLNPSAILPDERKVGLSGANGREAPNTGGAVQATLAPGSIHRFFGWINGEEVEGNKVWFKGDPYWYWSGGFEDTGTHDLPDLNPITSQERTTATDTNIRKLPYTDAALVGSEATGTTLKMKAWAEAEPVDGNAVWFQREDANWMWSGGFTSQSTVGIAQVPAPPPSPPYNPDNPRDLVEYKPVYPRATNGLEAPLGFTDCENPVTRTPRTSGYKPPRPTDGVIDRFIIHYTSVTNDQMDYFSYCNDRSVCPNYYLRTDGTSWEMIRPYAKGATTGPDWNWRAIAVETLCLTPGPEGKVTDIQLEELSQMIAWLAEFDGKELDGAPVSFTIDRTHVISHQEAIPGTECPGEYIQPRMDSIVERAKVIYEERHPPTPGEDYVVSKELGNQIRNLVNLAFPVE